MTTYYPPSNRLRRALLPAVTLLAVTTLVLALPGVASGQDIISELRIIYGGSSGIQAPAGFTKVNVDLNRNAGGDYMYLCYKKGTGTPITGIHVSRNGGGAPDGYTKINIDLNRHAGGDYIYLWYTTDPDCGAIHDITVLIGSSTKPPAGYTRNPVDLNDGAGGSYLYFAYLKI